MLTALHVKNLALIDEEEVFFDSGLNILSGETGAGKSVLIGSLNLALGQKADRDSIRTGKEYALVELTFTIDNDKIREVLKQNDIYPEDNLLLISRKIMPGKSVARVCGDTVTARQLKEISEQLIDIHGQHEHQSLLYADRQMDVLDDFCPDELKQCKESLAEIHRQYLETKNELDHALTDEADRRRQLDLLQYEYDEIINCNPKDGEDEALERDYRRMENYRRITEALSMAVRYLDSEDGGCDSGLMKAIAGLNCVEQYDSSLSEMKETLLIAEEQISDFLRSAERYLSESVFDEQVFRDTEDRLNVLNSLKDKYRCSLSELMALAKEKEQQINKLTDYDAYLTELRSDCKKLWDKQEKEARRISSIRKKEAKRLANEVTAVLPDLNFADASFDVAFLECDKISTNGFDKVEFMFSANPGEPLKPLKNVASGGELSRIMLALKTIVASRDVVDTLIFDEIDSGISGRTAWKVSGRLGILAKKKQIICITHLPQIAAMADHHFLIEKKITGNSANTTIHELGREEMTEELARLLGSGDITQSALQNASEMKELAEKTKMEQN